ncbi:MAG: hypothetical protein EPN22_04630 [Nitrospirae bacterium]|nr:MAG: hypothetical protein EPN22_04630 [Nitrospirota bacterium]
MIKDSGNTWFDNNQKKTFSLLIIFSLLLLFLAAEIALRIYYKELKLQYFITRETSLLKSAYPAQFDAKLGYIPRVGFDSTENFWGTKVTIGDDGIRSNGGDPGPHRKNSPKILAVGDSFTFGDQVSNDETWPAYLERLTGIPVLNGGVFGYALDQIVIRAGMLTEKYRPEILLISFIPDDITRSELANRRNTPKPYYTVEGNRLVLHDSHIIEKNITAPAFLWDSARNILGYSYFIHRVMSKNAPTLWYYGTYQYWKKSGADPEQVSCLLMDKLKELETASGAKTILIAQYSSSPSARHLALSKKLIDCAKKTGINVLDFYPVLEEIKRNAPEKHSRMFDGHMTALGNRIIAQELKDHLKEKKYLPLKPEVK